MGTNYYFMSRNKELMQTYFAEKSVLLTVGFVRNQSEIFVR